MTFSIINSANITDLSGDLLLPNGKLKLQCAGDLKVINWESLRAFCHFHARYGLPTRELINFINKEINGRTAIEIGAGHGDLGYHLQIPMTDSKIQNDPVVRATYEAVKQPIIKYPEDIVEMEALEAIEYFTPKVVIASWVTTYSPVETYFGSSPCGIKESKILKLVDTYILIGNMDIHGDKPIMKIPHEEIKEDFIVSRAKNQENNRIWIWRK